MKHLLAAALLFSAVAVSQPRWNDRPDDDDRPMMRRGITMMETLKLTDDQQKQFDKLRADFQKERIGMRSTLQQLRIDLRELYRAGTPDKGKIDATINEIGKQQTEMKLKQNDHWFRINKILTPEQQKIWREHRGRNDGLGGKDGRMHPGNHRRGRGIGMMRGSPRGSCDGPCCR